MPELDIRQLLRLALIPGVGNQRLRALISHFRDPARALDASPEELDSVPGLNAPTARRIRSAPTGEREIDAIFRKLDRIGGRIITYWDDEYPPLLKNIYDPPAYLYILGSLIPADRDSVAIVGTRLPSGYGKRVAEEFSTGLSKRGITVVSGLARGVDSTAHQAAVSCGGRTVAVIGCGIDIVYPQENVNLCGRIRERGAILSEYEPGTKPDAGNFPRRNRIISGMTLGTIIVESGEKGGAMITAAYAIDQNREIFAVPGNITERRSTGTNNLIQRGMAKLTLSVNDVIEEIAPQFTFVSGENRVPDPAAIPDLNMLEKKILETLSDQSMHIDRISELTGLSTSDALVHLLSLEFKGCVKQLAGKVFTRR